MEITRRVGSRENFATGALRVARFLADRAPGRYGMDDMLGLQPGCRHMIIGAT